MRWVTGGCGDKLCPPKGRCVLNAAERSRLAALLSATEYLSLENIALKLVLDHRHVDGWQKLVERLLADKEMLGGVRLKFRDIYRELEQAADPSTALEELLQELPAKKAH